MERPSGAKGYEDHGSARVALVFPVAVDTDSAAPHEVKLVEQTLASRFTDERPERLIDDKVYDSDPLDKKLAAFETEMIAPASIYFLGENEPNSLIFPTVSEIRFLG